MQIDRAIYEQFEGQLEARVQAFRIALEEHRFTVGIPAPVEHPLVEHFACSGEPIEIVEPEPPPEPGPLTEADYQRALETRVNAVAQARRYSSATSCASYAVSTVPSWAAEAAAFIAWRDQVYLEAFEALAVVEDGGDPPSIEDFIASLPAMVWPA